MIKELGTNEVVTSRMSGDERRSQILQVAIRLFSQNGFNGTTTKEIARMAGVSEAMVFRHFATKSELYHAILDYKVCEGGTKNPPWENPVMKRAIEERDDYAVFYNFGVGALLHHKEDVDFMRLLFYSALDEHELSQMFFDQFVSRIYEFIGSYIRQRQAEGAMREVEPGIVVRAFLGMLIHHSLNNILWDKKRRLLDVTDEKAARSFAEILLNGIKK
ncbi:MAG: TetR/AcrR family transcriptional regulator [Acidobacteria bacterium]|nr:TetR/AcrR family transcriptional regulator [Acidobacteriota bacterium]MCA1639760.1 TetR/AcrR family transcriptional regulator [Acidobacteriota bacterium]